MEDGREGGGGHSSRIKIGHFWDHLQLDRPLKGSDRGYVLMVPLGGGGGGGPPAAIIQLHSHSLINSHRGSTVPSGQMQSTLFVPFSFSPSTQVATFGHLLRVHAGCRQSSPLNPSAHTQ